MSRTVRIPQLVFSTRSAQGTSGAGAVREVIAESPGIPPELHSDFYRRADLVGSIARADLEQAAVYTFSSLVAGGEQRWLFCRTVSIGWYRGGHRLLTHGLVLKRSHLVALGGNPFLLENSASGASPFRTEHPGSDPELAPLAVSLPSVVEAGRRNRERFEELSRRLGGSAMDEIFPAAFDGLLAGGRVGCVLDPPSAEAAEWLLLHLHPDDRAVVSFHTWYCHGRAVPYRLMLLPPSDAEETRRQFPDALLVAEDARPVAGRTPGIWAQQLRQRSPSEYYEPLHRFRVYFLATEGELPPVEPDAVSVFLKWLLKGSLSADEKRLLRSVRGREEKTLQSSVESLVEARRSDPSRLPAAAEKEAKLHSPPSAATLEDWIEGQKAAPLELRWVILALLTCDTRRGPLTTDRGRAAAWRALMTGSERKLHAMLHPAETTILHGYLRDLAATSEGEGSALAPLVVHLLTSGAEPRIDGPLETLASAALLSATASALLETATAGTRAISAERWRVWLGVIAPRVNPEIAHRTGELLAACAVVERSDLLDPTAEHLRTAFEGSLEEPLHEALTRAAARLEDFAQRASPRRPELAFVRGLTLLLRMDREAEPSARMPRDSRCDRALADACFRGLIELHRIESHGERPPPLRQEWLGLLQRVSNHQQLDEVLAGLGWVDLLEDDLIRTPDGSADLGFETDPRRAALDQLAWRHWSRIQQEGGDSRAAEGRLLRLGRSREKQLLEAAKQAVEPSVLREAHQLLTFTPIHSQPSRGQHERSWRAQPESARGPRLEFEGRFGRPAAGRSGNSEA